MSASYPYCCPKCRSTLSQVERSMKCVNNHSFDIAAQGYVNLLMSGKVNTGDSREMVAARTAFLEKEYYKPLSDKLNETVRGLIAAASSPTHIVDCGCGEGYYTGRLQEYLSAQITQSSQEQSPVLAGVDISKSALKHASKQNKAVFYAVASIFELPLDDAYADVAVSIFAPQPLDEFARILRPGGVLLTVTPGSRHLFEMKEHIYDAPYENDLDTIADTRFAHLETIKLCYEKQIDLTEDLLHLFMMTPYYWKTSREDFEKLKTLTELKTTIAFEIALYERRA